ncbi:ATP11-domain-containing protein [Panus rudis PR-1116 ss-1]|nr:ATP11-domain-containing protein [Panus rudis PR-1116 ss-1]
MLSVATQYPSFVLPIPRENAQTEGPKSEGVQPAEFFFMQWGFHGAPPRPDSNDIFGLSKASSNPHTSTILFTPLQEYKLRGTFATPHLVITHYPDLADTHGLVLLRGEITPATSEQDTTGDGRYLLSQEDAQLLALGVQKFYLWTEGHEERMELLKRFHIHPEEFQWEDMLKHSGINT